jgi:hypothetical protein
VLNAGVGNYNAERSIHWFFTQLRARPEATAPG